jgi:S-adenosyl-L-methionine hydrolase (adenosine-forming)
MKTITLTTDFGTKDHYVGVMKGVIKSIHPDANIIDITHEIGFADIFAASYILKVSHRYFPDNAIHVVVVDPGVGSTRRSIAVRTEKGIFVGPDNGCLTSILDLYADAETRMIENTDLMLDYVSNTFHGRDIFAPAAAHLAKGIRFADLGMRITEPNRLTFPSFKIESGKFNSAIQYIDKFGNIITNINYRDHLLKVGEDILLEFPDKFTAKTAATFSAVKQGELAVVPGSSGYYEIIVNQGSAADMVKAVPGQSVILNIPGGIK